MSKVTLEDILEPFDERLGDRREPEVLTLTEKAGFVPQLERFNKRLATEDTSGYKLIRKGDVAFNPYLLWAGAIACNRLWQSAIISPAYPTFRVRDGFDSGYVDRLLGGEPIRQRYDLISFGAVPRRRRAKVEDFLAIELPTLPPLREQKRIAGILDAADVLRAKRRIAIAQLDALVQSVFLDMFGDPVTNPMGWEVRPIGEVFEVARGGSPRPIQSYLTDADDGLNWIMIGDAQEDSRYITSTKKRIKLSGLSKTRMVHQGDFLLTNSMSFGKPYILKTSGCIHDGWLVLSPKDRQMSSDFFYSLLGTQALYREFKRRAAGAVVKNLNTKLVKQVPVAVPPTDRQHRFAVVVESVEGQKARLKAHLAELDALFASLQFRAFQGHL